MGSTISSLLTDSKEGGNSLINIIFTLVLSLSIENPFMKGTWGEGGGWERDRYRGGLGYFMQLHVATIQSNMTHSSSYMYKSRVSYI